MFLRITKICARSLYWLIALSILFFALIVLLLRHWALPNVAEYKPEIEQRLSQSLQAPVTIGEVKASWSTIRPSLSLRKLAINTAGNNPDTSNRTNANVAHIAGNKVELEQADVSLSMLALLRGEVELHDVHLFAPRLEFVRDQAGRITLFGKVLNTPDKPEGDSTLLDWLRAQPGIAIEGATIVWTDLQPLPGSTEPPAPVTLRDVNLRVSRDSRLASGLANLTQTPHHRFAITASPTQGLAKFIEAKGDLQLGRSARQQTETPMRGDLYISATEADAAGIKRYLPRGLLNERFSATLNGRGNLRSWVSFETAKTGTRVTKATVDLSVINARVLVDENEKPVELASLSGRMNYAEQDGQIRLGSEALKLRLVDGVAKGAVGAALNDAQFSLKLDSQASAEQLNNEVSLSNINLAVVDALIGYLPLAAESRGKLAKFAPRGQVDQLNFRWSVRPATASHTKQIAKYTVEATVRDLAINAVEHHPGVKGLTAQVKGNERQGSVTVASDKLTLDAPLVFRTPLAFDKATAQASYTVTEATPTAAQVQVANAHIAEYNAKYKTSYPKVDTRAVGIVDVQLDQLRVESKDMIMSVQGTYRSLPLSITGHYSPGYVDIKGKFEKASLKYAVATLPNYIAATRKYLEEAITSGTITNAPFEIKGDMWDFPFEKGSTHDKGTFKLTAPLKDVSLTYKSDWPKLTDIDGKLMFDEARMELLADRVTTSGATFDNVKATIDSVMSTKARFIVDGTTNTQASAVVDFLRDSPLRDGPGAFTNKVELEGPGKLALGINIPLGQALVDERIAVKGGYTFNNNSASIGKDLTLKGLKGELRFTEHGAEAKSLTGEMFGNPTSVDIKTDEQGLRTTVTGKIASDELRGLLAPKLVSRLAGATAWQADFIAKDGNNELQIQSTLTGLTSTFPVPLSKPAAELLPLVVNIKQMGLPNERIFARLGDNIAVQAKRTADGKISSMTFAFGRKANEPEIDLAKSGLHLIGSLKTVDYDAWRSYANETQPAQAHSPNSSAGLSKNTDIALDLATIDLGLESVRFMNRDYPKMRIKLAQVAGVWDGAIASPDVEGKISWTGAAANGRGAFKGNFSRLYLRIDDKPVGGATSGKTTEGSTAQNTAAQTAAASASAASNAALPQIDITADDFKVRDQWLGKLELSAVPVVTANADNWRIDKLRLTTSHSTINATGGMRLTGSGPVTSINIETQANNLNATFNQFGYGDIMKRGSGKLFGQLNWPGYPYDFALNQLYGEYTVEWDKGQFAKLEPGFGKLLGLITLQSIPRRFTLDFRDIYSEGLAFDTVRGKVKVTRGLMLTEGFEISGPSAFISLSGEVSLPNETQKLRVRVVPEVSEGISIAAGIIGTPVLGLTTYVVQKLLQNPISKLVAYEYDVTGTWSEPVISSNLAAANRLDESTRRDVARSEGKLDAKGDAKSEAKTETKNDDKK